MLSKLTYITYATANPYKPITYTDFKGHADKYLNEDSNIINNKKIVAKKKSKEFSQFNHYKNLKKILTV